MNRAGVVTWFRRFVAVSYTRQVGFSTLCCVSQRRGPFKGHERALTLQLLSDLYQQSSCFSSSRRDTKSQWPHKFRVVEGSKADFSYKLTTLTIARKGEILVDFSDRKYWSPAREKRYSTLQVGEDQHIELDSELLYMNHSCNPSVYVDTEKFQVVALRDMIKGDELTFFYPSTEWLMEQPFTCWCSATNSSTCLRKVEGAVNLPLKELENHSPVSRHIRHLKSKQQAK